MEGYDTMQNGFLHYDYLEAIEDDLMKDNQDDLQLNDIVVRALLSRSVLEPRLQ